MDKRPSSFDPRDYWENRLRKNYDLTGVGHFSLGTAYNAWLYRVRMNVFRNRIAPLHREWGTKKVLDIGSGTGFYIDQWQRTGVRDVTGADLTSIAVSRLRSRFPDAAFHQIDITAETIPGGGPYDVISSFDVLFHIVDDLKYEQALRNIHAMLRQEGIFIFSDNFIHKDTVRWTHQVSRSLGEVEEVLGRTGFDVVDRFPMFVLMNGPVDSQWSGWLTLWNMYARILSLSNAIGFAAGALLYPLELLLLRLVNESPTTEIMVCRKTGRAQ